MASRNAMSDYELTLRILSIMEVGKPVALVTISQTTGIKLADTIRFCTSLIQANIIERKVDNGTIFYCLLSDIYEKRVAAIFNVPTSEPENEPEPENEERKPKDSREAIMMRRALRASGVHEKVNIQDADKSNNNGGTKKTNSPERLSAYDLYAMKRSSPGFARPNDLSRSSQRLPAVRSSTLNPAQSRDDDRRFTSSTTHKAVYINKPSPRRGDSRSSFNIMPPSAFDADAIERSDGIFKQTKPDAGKTQIPLIPEHALTITNNDIPENEVREVLQIHDDTPLITILSPRPCHELWVACSALANSGGGYIVLGLRKYENDGVIYYYAKSVQNPEDAIKDILRNFNDKNIISDCPKDRSFVSTTQLRKKNLLVIHIDPSQFAPAPLYTTRDSFGMKTHQGCYIFENGKIQHCTVDEVKALWQQKRLGSDVADWDQTSEQIDVEMHRKVNVHLPPVVDDAVRPLSRKTDENGRVIETSKSKSYTPKHRPYDELYEGEKLVASGFKRPRRPTVFDEGEDCLPPANPPRKIQTDNAQSSDNRTSTPSGAPTEAQGGLFHALGKTKIGDKRKEIVQSLLDEHKEIVQNILFADDFNIPSANHFTLQKDENEPARPRKKSTAEKANSAAHSTAKNKENLSNLNHEKSAANEANLLLTPPLYQNADANRIKEIVEPIINHPRLPMTRVCEIATQLCQCARFTLAELAYVLNKKNDPIKSKVLPVLRENPRFVEEDGVFYIK